MAGGAGFVYDMIGSLRGNSALRNHPYRKKVKEAYQKVEIKSNYKYKKASKEDLIKIRTLVKKEIALQNKKRIIAITITTMIALPFIYSIVYLLTQI